MEVNKLSSCTHSKHPMTFSCCSTLLRADQQVYPDLMFNSPQVQNQLMQVVSLPALFSEVVRPVFWLRETQRCIEVSVFGSQSEILSSAMRRKAGASSGGLQGGTSVCWSAAGLTSVCGDGVSSSLWDHLGWRSCEGRPELFPGLAGSLLRFHR